MARSERELRLRSSLVDLLSGMSGGLAVVTVGQPMDTIKVKMQTFGHLYSGVMQCVKKTWATEGIRKGNYQLVCERDKMMITTVRVLRRDDPSPGGLRE